MPKRKKEKRKCQKERKKMINPKMNETRRCQKSNRKRKGS